MLTVGRINTDAVPIALTDRFADGGRDWRVACVQLIDAVRDAFTGGDGIEADAPEMTLRDIAADNRMNRLVISLSPKL